MDSYDYAEQSFIGALITNSSWLDECKAIVKPECLKSTFLKRIYTTMLKMHEDGKEISLATVSQEVETKEYPQMTLVQILSRYAMEATSSALELANVIVKNYKLRTYISIINKAPDIMAANIDSELENTIEQLTGLSNLKRAVKVPVLGDIASEYRYTYFNSEYNPEYLYLGFQRLDAAIGGLEKGSLTCIGARPSVGKTALVNQIVIEKCKYNPTAFFSYEMNEKQILDRIIANDSGIPFDRIRNAKGFLNDEEKRFNYSFEKITQNKNLRLLAKPTSKFSTVSDIRRICKSIDGLSLIVIDYLQLIKPEKDRRGNRTNEVGDISRSLKELALELGVPIIVLSQLNRSLEYRPVKEPIMADLRESGDIEQDCDNIIFLWNIDESDLSRKGCKIGKCRNGTLAKVEMSFIGSQMRFKEIGILKESTNFKKSNDGFIESVDGNPFD